MQGILAVFSSLLTNYCDKFTFQTARGSSPICLDVAANHMASYKKRIDENARQMALSAAQILYDLCYDEKSGYIFRVCIGKDTADEKTKPFCRTMMDTMLNIPIFSWASEQTGDDKYKKAALAQCKTTNDYLIRADSSTYHHYQFELMTYKPFYGCTLQGNRDTSAGAIAACGMLSAADFMPLKDKEKSLYRTSANKIINVIIDKFTKGEYDGQVSGVTPMRKSNSFCTETNSLYGDYFFLEALLRLVKPDWQKTW